MKIIFFGTPFFSVPSLQKIHESSHELDAVVTIPDKKQGRGLFLKASDVKKYAESIGCDIIEVENFNSESFIENLSNRSPDIFIVVAFKILPEIVFNIPKYGSFNIHASLLPKYRGADPIRHALLNSENKTGVSIFQIEKKVDTGPLIISNSCKIEKTDNYDILFKKLSILSSEILIEFLNNFDYLYNRKVSQKKIKSDRATAFKISIEKQFIHWEEDTSRDIINKMRAFTSKPGLKTFFQNRKLTFKKISYDVNNNINLSNGFIKKINGEIFVGTCKGSIQILELQFDSKQKIEALSFWNGFCSKDPSNSFFKTKAE